MSGLPHAWSTAAPVGAAEGVDAAGSPNEIVMGAADTERSEAAPARRATRKVVGFMLIFRALGSGSVGWR